MSVPILATKLYIPAPRPKRVFRPRLVEHLNAGLAGKLTLVSAPAGFGKTTLLSEWIAGHERAAVWLSLDEHDHDPVRFLLYLAAALQTLDDTIGTGVLAALQSSQPPPIEALLTDLLNEIAVNLDPFVLILDDYHVLDSRAVDEVLAFLLDHLPPQLHLVITTREDPLLPVARLRARGQLNELRAADLRFTPAEAATFLNQVMGLDLSAADVSALETRTEGWIAGLQLAALSMRGRDDQAEFIRAFAGDHRYIVDYLVEEVLQHQPEQTRNFLLQTAILDRLSGPLCAAVTGQAESGALLELLERSNLFVVPLDNRRHWFRYHHLFADVLRAHLADEQPDQVPALHQRASAWYQQHALPADAVHHALIAADFERAADLIEQAWPEMDGTFQTTTWLDWVQALPDALFQTRPVLSADYAWALLNLGELEAAEARLGAAEHWLDATPPSAGLIFADSTQFQALPATVATARAYLAQAQGDVPGTIRYGQCALDVLPAGNPLQRGIVGALLGVAYWANGDLELAERTLAEGMDALRSAGNLLFALRGTYGLADIQLTQGRLRAAVRTYEQSLQLAEAEGAHVLRGTADLHLRLSELYREQDQREAAVRHLRISEELGEQAASPHWPYRLSLAQARLQIAHGDTARALELLDQAERRYVRTPVPDVRPIAAMKARVWIAQGRLAEALAWAQARGLTVDDTLSYLHEFEHLTLARLLLAQSASGQAAHALDAARVLLERLEAAAAAGGRVGSLIEIRLLQALAYEAQNQLSLALVPLERALTLAEPEGYVRIFVDEGAPLKRLLTEAAARGILPDYTGRLLAAFEAEHASQTTAPASRSLVEPLSSRELEILRLVADGLSNREIGEQLFLALDTIKGHNRRIFDKLQVQRRTEAVARARELGLL